MTDPSGEHKAEQAVPKRSVIGIAGADHYTLYDPATDHLTFLSIDKNRPSGKGFAEPNLSRLRSVSITPQSRAQQPSNVHEQGRDTIIDKTKQPSGRY